MHILKDEKIAVRYLTPDGQLLDSAPLAEPLHPAPLSPEVMTPLQQVVSELWPGTPVVPSMNTGASDGIYTDAAGLPTYGITGVGVDTDDVRAHGRDERVRAKAFYEGVDFYYRYLKAVTQSTAKQ